MLLEIGLQREINGEGMADGLPGQVFEKFFSFGGRGFFAVFFRIGFDETEIDLSRFLNLISDGKGFSGITADSAVISR